MEGEKVVSATEMARLEKLSYAKGSSDRAFMDNAGRSLADIVEEFVMQHHLVKSVALLAGKGNNGGDAFAAGRFLLEKKFVVVACHIFPIDTCSPLCREQYEAFQKAGGRVQYVRDEEDLKLGSAALILDGLVGTGFRGRAEGSLAKAIEKANHVKLPIIAIDIPSGVDGNTGDVGSVAINAALTVYLGLPKTGFFWGEGWNHVGLLRRADFGLPQEFVDQAKPQAHLVDSATLSNLLPPLKRNRHKYQAGYTLAFAGSVEMPGAAILSTSAAMRSGCGILRLFHPVDAASALSFSSVEVIKEGWDLKHLARILEESRRASSLLMGPGMGRGPLVQKALKKLLSTLSLPCILDADALYFLSEHPDTILPEKTVLTPHHQEMRRLLPQKDVTRETCQAFVDEKKVTLVLKGAPTWIFCPSELPLIIPRGDPGMATAGTGDVLAGMIAALLAQKLGSKEAAALAVFLHALAGEIAASEKTSYCLVASDLLDYLPRAFSHLKHKS